MPDEQTNQDAEGTTNPEGSQTDEVQAGTEESSEAVAESAPSPEEIARLQKLDTDVKAAGITDFGALHTEFTQSKQQNSQWRDHYAAQQSAEAAKTASDPLVAARRGLQTGMFAEGEDADAAFATYENALAAKIGRDTDARIARSQQSITSAFTMDRMTEQFGVTTQDVSDTIGMLNNGQLNEDVVRLTALRKGTLGKADEARKVNKARDAHYADLYSSQMEGRANGPAGFTAETVTKKPYHPLRAMRAGWDPDLERAHPGKEASLREYLMNTDLSGAPDMAARFNIPT